ncbi:MAG: hypothetical protein QG594_376 [Bacteroidota bacterium]|nr:hypothetical protein [Bacteroidota bacterium]
MKNNLTHRQLGVFYSRLRQDFYQIGQPLHQHRSAFITDEYYKANSYPQDDIENYYPAKKYLSLEISYKILLNKIRRQINNGHFSSLSTAQKTELLDAFDTFFHAHFGELPKSSKIVDISKYKFLTHGSFYSPAEYQNTFEGFSLQWQGKDYLHHYVYKDNTDIGKFIAIMLLSIFTAFTFLACYYLLNRIVNACERFYFNEDWFRATVSIGSVLAGAAMGACLGYHIIGPLIMYFGFVVLGLSNPAICLGMAFAGVALTALFVSTLTSLAVNGLQKSINNHLDRDALLPYDAARYELTQAQEKYLIKLGFDINKVKHVITIMAYEIHEGSNTKELPSCLSRFFSTTPRMRTINELLACVRSLKAGTHPVTKPVMGIDLSSESHQRSLDRPWKHSEDSSNDSSDDISTYSHSPTCL